MGYIVFFTATGLTIEFVYTFLYLFYNRHTMIGRPGRHRHPSNQRSKRIDVKEIITTGDIYRESTSHRCEMVG